jgi:FtsZ-binding cell division protein ZapB
MESNDKPSSAEKPDSDLPEKIYAVEYAGFWDFNESGQYDDSVINADDYPNAEQIAKEIQRRYNEFLPLRAELQSLKEENAIVRELLPIIHGDGGHYVGKHGLNKAVEDAIEIVCSLKEEIDELKSDNGDLHKELCRSNDENEKLRRALQNYADTFKVVMETNATVSKERDQLREAVAAAQRIIEKSGPADLLFWTEWNDAVKTFESLLNQPVGK